MYSRSRNLSRPGAISQRGFTLVEAMVAVMILSVGMIGLAYLQATGMRFTTTSYQRTQASILTADYFDTMRTRGIISDAARAAGGKDARDLVLTHDYAPNANLPDCNHLESSVVADADCWLRTVMQAIPSASAVVTVDEIDPTNTLAGGFMATIQVRWLELKPREEPGGLENFVERSFSATSFLTER